MQLFSTDQDIPNPAEIEFNEVNIYSIDTILLLAYFLVVERLSADIDWLVVSVGNIDHRWSVDQDR